MSCSSSLSIKCSYVYQNGSACIAAAAVPSRQVKSELRDQLVDRDSNIEVVESCSHPSWSLRTLTPPPPA